MPGLEGDGGDLGEDAGVPCEVPGLADELLIFGNPADIGVFGGIRQTHRYEPHVMHALRRLLPSDAVCIDGGANIGVLSLAMARYAPRGHVYAFEPGLENHSYLVKNLAANGATNVTPARSGLWSSTGTMQLNVQASDKGSAFVGASVDSYSTAENIDVTTLDQWVSEHDLQRLDLIKIDVEGAEPSVLDGAEETIRRFRPALVVEFNPVPLQRFHGKDCWQLLDKLERLFGTIAAIRGDGSTVRLGSRRLAARLLLQSGILDLVCLPDGYQGRRAVREHVRSLRTWAGLEVRYNRWRPSSQAFIYQPRYTATFLVTALRVRAGATTTLPLRIVNKGDVWLNSEYPHHPIRAAYRWLDEQDVVVTRDSPRTLFHRPIGPGRKVVIDLHVEAPLEPGAYVLSFSLVQERFAWCDELWPGAGARIPVTVI